MQAQVKIMDHGLGTPTVLLFEITDDVNIVSCFRGLLLLGNFGVWEPWTPKT